ncbi:MAG: hypothetical protein IPK26_14735 [Planctomycetes bacterium]|nr:hypothetical protein [Planctomycetota bacterium]
MTAGPQPQANDFPDERDWLSLPAPEISPRFVDETVARILADRRWPEPENEPASLPQAALAAFAPPAASPDFVASTLATVQRDRHANWRSLLARYVAPEPSPDFVRRTLRALQREQPAPVTARHPLRLLTLALTAAAAVLLAIAIWPTPRGRTLEGALVAALPADAAMRLSPAPVATLVSLTDTANDPFALPHVVPDRAARWRQRGRP